MWQHSLMVTEACFWLIDNNLAKCVAPYHATSQLARLAHDKKISAIYCGDLHILLSVSSVPIIHTLNRDGTGSIINYSNRRNKLAAMSDKDVFIGTCLLTESCKYLDSSYPCKYKTFEEALVGLKDCKNIDDILNHLSNTIIDTTENIEASVKQFVTVMCFS